MKWGVHLESKQGDAYLQKHVNALSLDVWDIIKTNIENVQLYVSLLFWCS